jgi:hypothetical protein
MSPFGSEHARVGADGTEQLRDELGRSHEWRGIVARCADGRDADEALEVRADLRHELAHAAAEIGRWDRRHRVIMSRGDIDQERLLKSVSHA